MQWRRRIRNSKDIAPAWRPTPAPLSATTEMHRWVWGLRPTPAGNTPRPGPFAQPVPAALPGTHTVRLTVNGKSYAEPLRVRLLDESDTAEAPMVAVVNETFARKFFPDEDPVGKRVTVDYTNWFPRMTIVGVVADVKLNALDRKPFAEMFWPVAQAPSRDVWLTVRTNVEPLALASAVQREIREIDRDLPILEMSSMEGVIADSLWRPRFSGVLIGLFAGLALLLAAAGIYGVMSYQVGLRTREIGLRIALGADRRRIFALIIRRGIKLALAGAIIGAAVSLALGRLVASQLYGVSAYDPPTLVGVSLFLIGVAALACYLPARRATKVDPMVALRAQ